MAITVIDWVVSSNLPRLYYTYCIGRYTIMLGT